MLFCLTRLRRAASNSIGSVEVVGTTPNFLRLSKALICSAVNLLVDVPRALVELVMSPRLLTTIGEVALSFVAVIWKDSSFLPAVLTALEAFPSPSAAFFAHSCIPLSPASQAAARTTWRMTESTLRIADSTMRKTPATFARRLTIKAQASANGCKYFGFSRIKLSILTSVGMT